MEKIRIDEIKNLFEYEKARPQFRSDVVAVKKNRRVPLGDLITLVFENRQTVLFQIQEMIRVERIVDERAIQQEIDTYNMLVPGKDELSATMLIEITELSQIKATLDTLVGLQNRCFFLDLNEEKMYATFDPGQSEDDRISAVQYIKFSFTDAQKKEFMRVEIPAAIVSEHPNYRHRATLAGDVRRSLIEDLTV